MTALGKPRQGAEAAGRRRREGKLRTPGLRARRRGEGIQLVPTASVKTAQRMAAVIWRVEGTAAGR